MNLELSQDQQKMREPFARFLNDECTPARAATRSYGGTSDVHRSMIAEHALGLPRSRG